jgi:hypothetical protein
MTNGSVAENEPFGEVRRKAFGVLDPASLNSVADYVATKARFDETALRGYWEGKALLHRHIPNFSGPSASVLQISGSCP